MSTTNITVEYPNENRETLDPKPGDFVLVATSDDSYLVGFVGRSSGGTPVVNYVEPLTLGMYDILKSVNVVKIYKNAKIILE